MDTGFEGAAPAVGLVDPKFPHNVGAAVRAASCYGVRQVWFSGERVQLDARKGYRLPREERMRGYKDVVLRKDDRFLDRFGDAVPVAVELRRNAESLIEFEHPDNALYVFGPEDGSLDRAVLARCHRFVVIPTRHCTNLASAVYTVLYDRHAKRVRAGLELPHAVAGDGDFDEPDHMADAVGVTWGRPLAGFGGHSEPLDGRLCGVVSAEEVACHELAGSAVPPGARRNVPPGRR